MEFTCHYREGTKGLLLEGDGPLVKKGMDVYGFGTCHPNLEANRSMPGECLTGLPGKFLSAERGQQRLGIRCDHKTDGIVLLPFHQRNKGFPSSGSQVEVDPDPSVLAREGQQSFDFIDAFLEAVSPDLHRPGVFPPLGHEPFQRNAEELVDYRPASQPVPAPGCQISKRADGVGIIPFQFGFHPVENSLKLFPDFRSLERSAFPTGHFQQVRKSSRQAAFSLGFPGAGSQDEDQGHAKEKHSNPRKWDCQVLHSRLDLFSSVHTGISFRNVHQHFQYITDPLKTEGNFLACPEIPNYHFRKVHRGKKSKRFRGGSIRMGFRCQGFVLLVAIGLFSISVAAFGSGFALKEQSVAGLGCSFAGSTTGAHDLGDMFFNPATLVLHEGRNAQISGTQIRMSTRFTFRGATNVANGPILGDRGGADIANDPVIPAFYFGWEGRKKDFFGLSINAPWGMESINPPGWVGRYYALESRTKSLNISPVYAKKISPSTALAFGLQAQQFTARLSAAIDFGMIGAAAKLAGSVPGQQDGLSIVQGEDWGYGFTVGVLHEPSPKNRFGFSYRSRVVHRLTGNTDFQLDPTGTGAKLSAFTGGFRNCGDRADLTTPEVISAGWKHSLSPKWAVVADVSRTGWSCLKELRVKFDNPAQPDSATDEKWHDTWCTSFGVLYNPDTRWTWRMGLAQDASPIPDETRHPRIPDSDRRWFSLGVGYHPSSRFSLELGWARIAFDDAPIQLLSSNPLNTFRGNLLGNFDSKLSLWGLQAEWHF